MSPTNNKLTFYNIVYRNYVDEPSFKHLSTEAIRMIIKKDNNYDKRMCFRLTCAEPYFVSEGLYCLPEDLENTREVTLRVITIGKFVTDPTEVSDSLKISCINKFPPPIHDNSSGGI